MSSVRYGESDIPPNLRLRKIIFTECYLRNPVHLISSDDLDAEYQLYSRVLDKSKARNNDLVIVPPVGITQGLIDCPYKQRVDEAWKKVAERDATIQELILLRLVTECFSLYRTHILIPHLKGMYPNDDQIPQNEPHIDLAEVSSEKLIAAVKETGVLEDEYDALNDLRHKRNRLCHIKPLRKQDIISLGRQAQKFKIFRSGVLNESNYPAAARRLSNVLLQKLPNQYFHPPQDFSLTNKLR